MKAAAVGLGARGPLASSSLSSGLLRSRSWWTTPPTSATFRCSCSPRSRSIPLAWLIGEATEHAAEHTGPGIGGFLNATFGNAPELIIALIAVNQGLTEVVRGSLTGSVIGNLLLVLGFSLLAGGRGELDRWSSFVAFAVLAVAILLFLIPAVPSWDGDPDRAQIVDLSVPISIVLARRLRESSPGTRCGGIAACTSLRTRSSRGGR